MRTPNSFTDGTCIGIVVGGDINDPASDHSGGMRIFIPGLHGRDVDVRHLAFSSMQKGATNMSQQSFEGVLDPGSVVYVRKDTGSNMCHILGTANEIYDPNSTVSGNFNLLSLPQIQQAIQRQINIRVPPQIQETSSNGVRVRTPQEKGELHRHALLAGIPANGAVYPLAGSIVPNITNVPTAIQAFTSILTPALAALLPGINASLGSMLTSLRTGNLTGSLAARPATVGLTTNNTISIANTSTANTVSTGIPGEIVGPTGIDATTMITTNQMKEYSRELMSKFTPQMKTTFTSMSMLMSSIETTTGAGFMSGGRVDPNTYMTNTVSLLGQCRGIGDMVSCMQQLQYDNSLFGTNKLSNITMNVSTPFGTVPFSISPTGSITQNTPATILTVVNAFISAISSAAGYPGVVPTQNLFGTSAPTMFNMYQRLSPQAQAVAVALSTTVNQTPIAQLFATTNRITNMGGNPFLTMFAI